MHERLGEIQCCLFVFTKFQEKKINAIHLKLPSKAEHRSSGTAISFVCVSAVSFSFSFRFFVFPLLHPNGVNLIVCVTNRIS